MTVTNWHRRATVAFAALVVLCGARDMAAQTRVSPGTTLDDVSDSLQAVARVVNPAIVQIFATSYEARTGLIPRNADLVTTQRASGSGVIVDSAGLIVTNAHVVRGAARIRVEIGAGLDGASLVSTRIRSVVATVLGMDNETDLAVLKVDAQELPALSFGDSDQLRPGQVVLAFGAPLGLRHSVSLGVVSAVARQLEPESTVAYVQTDASINPGNSGGPLVDARGRMIGINTFILSQTGGNEGLGFAIPSNVARFVVEQIRRTGRVRRGEIGVTPQTLTPVLAGGLALTREYGVILADVLPGSPAAVAGLRVGDVVLSLDGKPMENGPQFHVAIHARVAGDIATLDVLRAGDIVKIPVAVAEPSDPYAGLSPMVDPRQNLIPRLGILGVPLTPRVAATLPNLRSQSGLLVASTVAGALDSREGGLAPGDIIRGINNRPVAALADLQAVLGPLQAGDPVVLQIERDGGLIYLAFTVE